MDPYQIKQDLLFYINRPYYHIKVGPIIQQSCPIALQQSSLLLYSRTLLPYSTRTCYIEVGLIALFKQGLLYSTMVLQLLYNSAVSKYYIVMGPFIIYQQALLPYNRLYYYIEVGSITLQQQALLLFSSNPYYYIIVGPIILWQQALLLYGSSRYYHTVLDPTAV